MTPLGISFIAFACVVVATLVGLFVHDMLPKDHLSDDSKDTVKLGMGMVATLAAGARPPDRIRQFLQQHEERDPANCRKHCPARSRHSELRGGSQEDSRSSAPIHPRPNRVDLPEGKFEPSGLESAESVAASEAIQGKLRELSPCTDAQRWLQSRAVSLSGDIAQTRWLLIAQADSPLPPVLLAVLIFWIAMIFLSFGLFAPRNATVLVALLVCALSVSGSIFLLLELNGPFDGAIRISSAPMLDALAHLGR